jgi:hypothetical protein
MSGAIWDDHDTDVDREAFALADGRVDLSRNDPIPEAREEFKARATEIKTRLMRLLETVMEIDGAAVGSDTLYEEINRVCLDVGSLASGTANETERDLFNVCDLLAISLGTTYAAACPDDRLRDGAPYLAEAFSQACGKAI